MAAFLVKPEAITSTDVSTPKAFGVGIPFLKICRVKPEADRAASGRI